LRGKPEIAILRLMTAVERWICKMDARHRTIIGCVAAAITSLLLWNHVKLATMAAASWDAFGFVVLILAWVVILKTPQIALRARAQKQDVGQFIIFLVIVVAASIALFAVGFVLGHSKSDLPTHLAVHLFLTFSTVIFSWALLHTVFGLRYAHMFYGDDIHNPKIHAAGLLFPGDRPPDYFDFAYFSFVVGMTCQVSDVQITSRRLRRLTLLHSLLAFGFNTLILALLINTVSGLL
jgi:uncharacterized membrane protein